MPKIKLTDAAVQRLKAPKGERVEYFDATLPGFGLRVAGPTDRTPEGRRTWFLTYRFGGEQKRLSFEPVYPALGLADARRKAGDALQVLAAGNDPAALKAEVKADAARKADTVDSVVELFMRRHMEAKKRAPAYVAVTQRNFDNHVLPRWKGRNIKSITRRDVIELLDAIVDEGTDVTGTDGKKRHVDGGPIAANRVLAAIRVLFNFALRRSIIDSSPVALVERPGQETARERELSDDEIRAIWPAFSAVGYPFGDFFKLALITGQRRQEVAGMRWADVDLAEKVWTIPGELTKARRAHVVPLPSFAVDILTSLPRIGPHVFTTGGERPISGFSKGKIRIDAKIAESRKKADLDAVATWTIHDLRRTMATNLSRLEVARFVVSKVLNHADRSVTGVHYDRYAYLKEKRAALEAWGEHLRGIVPPLGGNVVQLSVVKSEAA